MRKLLLFYIILFNFVSANTTKYVDFGVLGTLYDIQEINGNDLIEEGLKDINVTEIAEMLSQQIENAFTSNISLPDSNQDSNITKKDLVPARWDVIGLNGEVLARKGDLILSEIPKGMSFSLCFINGDDPKEIVDYVVKEFGKCIYMVNRMDSRLFQKIYNYEAYPISNQSKDYLERFNIKVFPTKITKRGSFLHTKTLNIIKLKKLLRDGLWEKK